MSAVTQTLTYKLLIWIVKKSGWIKNQCVIWKISACKWVWISLNFTDICGQVIIISSNDELFPLYYYYFIITTITFSQRMNFCTALSQKRLLCVYCAHDLIKVTKEIIISSNVCLVTPERPLTPGGGRALDPHIKIMIFSLH